MKTRSTISFLLFIIFQASAQPIEVNKYIPAPFGHPVSEIDWANTTTDAGNNIIVVGNTYVSGDITGVLVCNGRSGEMRKSHP